MAFLVKRDRLFDCGKKTKKFIFGLFAMRNGEVMLKMALLEYKKRQRLFCLACGILFSIFMYLSQCRIDDWIPIAKPLDEKEFLYLLLIEDYKHGKVVSYPFLEQYYRESDLRQTEEVLTVVTKNKLDKLLRLMNPDYDKDNKSVYDIDFSKVDNDQLADCLEDYSVSLNVNGMRYLPSNFKTLYQYYSRVSPFFYLKDEVVNEEILGKTIQSLLYAAEKGYMKYNILFGYNMTCSENEKQYLLEKADQLATVEFDNLQEVLLMCNSVMTEVDEYFGGNTSFSPDAANRYTTENYEEAINNYYLIETKEGIGFALARYTSDYMGICAGIMPVFLSAFSLGMGGKKKRELLMICGIKSYKLVLSEIVGVFLPFFILFLTIYFVDARNYIMLIGAAGGNLQYFAYPFYFVFWIIPTLMMATTLPMLLFEVVHNEFISALLSVLIMFVSMATRNNYIFQPIIRFNSFGRSTEFFAMLPNLVLNRIIMAGGAIVLFVLITWLYEYRRTHN